MTTKQVLGWSDACSATVKDWREGKPRKAYEITEEAYWWGLECVPPRMMKQGAYLCGEPYTDNEQGEPLYSAAFADGDRTDPDCKYYALGLMTAGDLRTLSGVELRKMINDARVRHYQANQVP